MPGGSDLSKGYMGEENSHQLHLWGAREWRNSSLAIAFVFTEFHVLPTRFGSALCLAGGRGCDVSLSSRSHLGVLCWVLLY